MPLFLSGNSGSATLDSSNGLIYPTWTTAGRPASPATGQMGYNTTIGGIEIYNGSAWDCITGGPAFSAYTTASVTCNNNTTVKMAFNGKQYDTASCYDATTNYRFTPNVAGYYQINASIYFGGQGTGSNAWAQMIIKQNGSSQYYGRSEEHTSELQSH